MHTPKRLPFDENSVLVAGYGKLPQGTSAEQLHKVLALAAVVDRRDGRVLDASSTLAASVADEFVSAALVGKSLKTDSVEFIEFLMSHYHGLAQRALVAAFRDLVRRFAEATSAGGPLAENPTVT
jgi:Domain of unknown function (DUF3870)